ncbi:DNA sulfur modification protein DndB [Gloeocapsopsis crepidinum LEGE 06123]|uniref:DNA sulfur modification protein DndB n=1 Tax=Gloeocapsopsis crepidinum LEGE 06123 TaxID=588587 RepID=A0ABR9URC7_9CHRO|nr:DNA sulfur modification protein DndB [Gloeocapsopsis crepidinum]MBE9190842.1 DNA sulfur modification protein DndB [Gloeocapsopsis crepidinum LEGE 06123]
MVETSEDNINNRQQEIYQRLDLLLEPYFSKHHRERCYPGLIFQQGKRKMVQINVPARDLPILLQAIPSTGNDPDSGKNRPEVKGHAEEIKNYVVERAKANQPWVLGTITANADAHSITVHELGRGICIVVIPNGVKLDITDGQHRKSAIQELIFSYESHLIGDDDFPITLILEADKRQCQIDFKDMAQTRPLDKSLLLSFGEYSGRVGITKELISRVLMFQGKTDKINANPATKKGLIYTTNYIARFVSCVFANDPADELKNYEVEAASASLADCLNQFFSECNNTQYIIKKKFEDLTVEDVSVFKEECLLGVSAGLEVLGRLLYHTYAQEDNYFNETKISQLAQLDWSRENELWRDNIVRIDLKPKNPAKAYKVSFGGSAIAAAVSIVKVKLGWT